MSADAALAAGRAAAEALMADTCTITAEAVTSIDQMTGERAVQVTNVYDGSCKVQHQTPGGVRPVNVAESHQLMLRLSVHVPMVVTGVRVGHIVTITASARDPELVGRRFRVRELAHKTWATARRLGVEEVT